MKRRCVRRFSLVEQAEVGADEQLSLKPSGKGSSVSLYFGTFEDGTTVCWAEAIERHSAIADKILLPIVIPRL